LEQMASDQFRTVTGSAVTRALIQRSEFLAHVRPVQREEEARVFIAEIADQHKQATHNCWAFRVGWGTGEISNCDDDGEPRGTAGKPILGAIFSKGVTNVAVVVTRYFGGRKLGIRGLIEAYGGAAADAIQLAGVKVETVTVEIHFNCQYSVVNQVLYLVNRYQAQVVDSTYGADVELIIRVRQRDAQQMREILNPLGLMSARG